MSINTVSGLEQLIILQINYVDADVQYVYLAKPKSGAPNYNKLTSVEPAIRWPQL